MQLGSKKFFKSFKKNKKNMNQIFDILLKIFGIAGTITSTIGFHPQVFKNCKKNKVQIYQFYCCCCSWFFYALIKIDLFYQKVIFVLFVLY